MNKIPFSLIAISFLIMALSPLYAIELVNDEGIVRTLTGDFSGDGVKETVTLKARNVGDWADYDLEVTSGKQAFLIKDVLIGGSPSIRGLEKIDVSPKTNPFIGISYHCGAHSWQVDLYSFDDKKITEVAGFFSDAPSIELKDIDNDGINEIIAIGRDYWHSPISDHFIKTYKYDGSKWNLMSVYETRTKKFLPPKQLREWRK